MYEYLDDIEFLKELDKLNLRVHYAKIILLSFDEKEQYGEIQGTITAGTIEYAFDQIESIDIETDPGTILLIGADASNAISVRVNMNGRYVIKPTDGMIKYIAFKDGCYALVNYKCTTTATKIKKGV